MLFSRVGMEGEEGGVTGLARVQRLEDYRRKARFKQVQNFPGIAQTFYGYIS